METYHGILSLREMNAGSKAEGIYTFLKVDEDKEYMLYRKDVYPADDAFFAPYDGMELSVNGTLEPATNTILIEELHLPDGTLISAPENTDYHESIDIKL